MNYLEEIKKVLKTKSSVQNITLETKFNELGLDSLDLMDLVVQLEKQIGKQVPDNKLMGLKTVGDLIEVIKELTQ